MPLKYRSNAAEWTLNGRFMGGGNGCPGRLSGRNSGGSPRVRNAGRGDVCAAQALVVRRWTAGIADSSPVRGAAVAGAGIQRSPRFMPRTRRDLNSARLCSAQRTGGQRTLRAPVLGGDGHLRRRLTAEAAALSDAQVALASMPTPHRAADGGIGHRVGLLVSDRRLTGMPVARRAAGCRDTAISCVTRRAILKRCRGRELWCGSFVAFRYRALCLRVPVVELPLFGGPGRPAPAGDVRRTPGRRRGRRVHGTRRRLGGRAVGRR